MKKILLGLAIATIFGVANCFAVYDSSFGGQHFDEETDGLVTTNSPAYMVHQGDMFVVSASTQALATGTSCQFLVDLTSKTVTHQLHAVFSVAVGSNAFVELYEDNVYTSSGAVVTPRNMNRYYIQTLDAGIKMYASPTSIKTTGTLIFSSFVPAGTVKPLQLNTGSEWVLHIGHSYTVVVTNLSAGSMMVSGHMECYEK